MKPIRVDDITGIIPFIASVDWLNNKWLWVVLAFHVLCLASIVVFRRNHVMQTLVFVILMVSVYGAEYINEWAAKNYRAFSTEQYFDSNGLFFSVFYSFPALLNCCIVLLFWLYESGSLMFNAKKQDIQRQQQRKQQNRENGKSPETTKKRERLRRRPRVDEDAADNAEENGDAAENAHSGDGDKKEN